VLCSGEYTLEGSPETVTSEKIKTAKEHGVNRVSIGVESWDDSVLTAINRRHTAAVAEQAIHNIRLAGITDIDIDLIRGLPGQTRESLARDVQICAELDIPSITCYQYSLKPRSVDAKVISSTGYEFSDDDLIELGVIVDTGFSLAGYQAGYPAGWYTKNVSYKHNIIKWQEQANQIAIGVSSYGYWEGTSFSNTSSIKEYYKLIDDGVLPITKASDLTVTEIARRHFMFALKTVADVKKLNDKYNFDIISTLGLTEKINMLLEAGAISVNDGRITLTPLGRLFADQIIMSMYNETFKDT
jgi:oxygen-independent coproporphyrinogen-3 oxidase